MNTSDIKTATSLLSQASDLLESIDETSWKALSPAERGDLYMLVDGIATLQDTLKGIIRNTIDKANVKGVTLGKPKVTVSVSDWKATFKLLEKKYPFVTREALEATLSCSYSKLESYVTKYIKVDPTTGVDEKSTLRKQLADLIKVSTSAPSVSIDKKRK